MDIQEKIQICKVVAQAILADARLTDSERDFLYKLMDRYQLNEAQRNEVVARNIEDDPEELVAALETEDARNQLLVELALAVASDGEIAKTEMELLQKVAGALNVSDADLALMLKAAIS